MALAQPITPVFAANSAAAGKTASAASAAADKVSVDKVISTIIAAYEKKDALSDWEAYGLLLNGKTPPKSYFTALDKTVKTAKGSFRTVTDYARLAIVYRAAGYNPSKAAGYDLIKGIYSYDNINKQGLMGPVWALIALNGQTLPKNAKWNADNLAGEILKYQVPALNGGFSLTTGKSAKADLDATCMAVAALTAAKDALKDDANAQKAVGSAMKYLALSDSADKIKKTSEAVSQYIIALCAMGADAKDWVNTLLGFKLADGTFSHIKGGKSDSMATEQALLALTAYEKGGKIY